MNIEIVKAFNILKDITTDQFTRDNNVTTYHGSDEQYELMLQQFDSVKPILFYTTNNKWLIMQYLTDHKEYMNDDKFFSLAQLVLILLGFQGQDAYDNGDKALEDKLHVETCIWQSIILNAKYNFTKAS
jgi:hypothetical protein